MRFFARRLGLAVRWPARFTVIAVAGTMLVLPASALAAAPSATTNEPTITGSGSATLNGDVLGTGGLDTTYNFDYALNTSTYCTSGGTSGTSTSTPTGSLSASSGGGVVSANVSGLTPGAQYCYQLVASNTDGPSDGGIVIFTSGAPSADTSTATVTGAQTVNISGDADAAGQAGATVQVDYDLNTSPWCSSGGTSGSPGSNTTAQTFNNSDAQFHPVTLPVTGLTAGTTYCAAIAITNPSGTTISSPVSFTAGAPFADTFTAQATNATAATISGDVDPSGQSGVKYQADYALTTDPWCTSGGTAGTPTATTPVTLPDNSTNFDPVTVNLTGLTAGSSYCAEIVANANGVSNVGAIGDADSQVQFTAGVPTADTTKAVGSGPMSGTVTGDVNPSGQTTQYFADYALATDPWCTSGGTSGTPSSTSSAPLGATDATSHQVTVNIGGLTANTGYCAEIVATNGSGSSLSDINSSGVQLPFTPGGPAVDTAGVDVTGTQTATVSGDVNPAGQTTQYFADYALQSSTWCTSGGTSGTPTSTSPVGLGFSDTTSHPVTVNLTGLTTGDAYCAAIVATNSSGTTVGTPPQNFTQVLLPIVSAGSATATGAATETLSGTVNPNGSSTNYQFQYALTTDTWCTSGGNSGTPTSTGATSAGSGVSDVPVSANLGSLTPGSRYCWQLSATNGGGTATSGNLTTFTAGLPLATTTAATAVGSTGATLNGSVNPEGNSTEFRFDYDVSTSQWCTSNGSSGSPANSTSETPVGFTDTSGHAVNLSVSGLQTGTTYCFQMVASNAAGDASGAMLTFTTKVPVGGPGVTTGAATGVSSSGATLNGTVNPSGSATTYHFEYGTTTGYGTPTPAASAGSGSSPVAVSAAVNGLAPNTTYHFRLVAQNGVATVDGPDQTFATGSGGGGGPATETLTVLESGTGSGTVTSSPAGISCPGTCSASYAQGTKVSLTADPAAGSTFAGWSGACSGNGACTVTLDPNQTVTATFAKNPVPVPPTCSLRLASGKVLLKKHKKGPLKKVKPGTVMLTAVCNQSANAVIVGKITAKGKKPKHGKAKTTTYTFSVSVALSAGVPKSVVVSLPGAAVSALSKGATETVLFTLTATDANGAGRATASGALKGQK